MFNMFTWGKRKLAIGSDVPDEGTSSKKSRRCEEETRIASNDGSGKLYKRDDRCNRHQAVAHDDFSDSDENEDDRPLEEDQGSCQPHHHSPSNEHPPKYVSSGMNTVETGEVRLDQSSTLECGSRGSTVSKESPCRHFCQSCGKSSTRIRSQISKMCLKSVTSRESRPLIVLRQQTSLLALQAI
uniref:Ubiquitin carboxyl-terminal hydrolase 15 n=1 Tax=Lygus hesperus TaxID=30085 RepID=A0A0A9W539_LYGHE